MNSNAEVLSNFPPLVMESSPQQRSPTTSNRSAPPFGAVSDDEAVGAVRLTVSESSQNKRRSSPIKNKSLHGNYEGDFLASRLKLQKTANNLILKAEMARVDDDYDMDPVLSAKIREIDVGVKLPTKEVPTQHKWQLTSLITLAQRYWQSFWLQTKAKLFSETQLKKIDDTLVEIKQNFVFCKIVRFLQFLMIMVIFVVRSTLTNAFVCLVNMNWNASRMRGILRNSSRRLLWLLILAKYGDLQLFALTLLLVPLVFFLALIGFVLALYSTCKRGFKSLMGHVRHIDLEVQQYEKDELQRS